MGLIALECNKSYEREGLVGYEVHGIMTQGDDSLDGKGLVISMQDNKGEVVAAYDTDKVSMEEAVSKVLEIKEEYDALRDR